jgi:hypothetical protein
MRHHRAVRHSNLADSIAELRKIAHGRAGEWLRIFTYGLFWRWLQAERPSEVRRRHDQDMNVAPLGRCPSSSGRSGSFTWFRDSTACYCRRLADRAHPKRSVPASDSPQRVYQRHTAAVLSAASEHRICGEARPGSAGRAIGSRNHGALRTAYG